MDRTLDCSLRQPSSSATNVGKRAGDPRRVEGACNHLADVLLRECKNVIDELTYRPVTSTNPGTLLKPDISTASHVVVGGRELSGNPS